MPKRVSTYVDLPSLIRALANRHHGGAIYQMAQHIGVSVGTVQQWENGLIKTPTLPTLRKLARAYDLDLNDLIQLVSKPLVPIGGGSAAGAALPVPQRAAIVAEVLAQPLPAVPTPPRRDIMSTRAVWTYYLCYLIRTWTPIAEAA